MLLTVAAHRNYLIVFENMNCIAREGTSRILYGREDLGGLRRD